MSSMVDEWLGSLRNLAATPRCLLCTADTDGAAICAGCTADLPWNRSACPGCAQPMTQAARCPRCQRRPQTFDSAWTAFTLHAPVHQAILGLKYHARFERAQLLGELMGRALASRAEPLPALLIPVPLYRGRLLRRGYNQSLELAHALTAILSIEVDAHSARRIRATEDQIGQSAAARRRKLRGAFEIRRDLTGLHIALLDDVLTTGSTLSELARVCRRAGAARIEAWAAARTP